jgi:hypothetical protein
MNITSDYRRQATSGGEKMTESITPPRKLAGWLVATGTQKPIFLSDVSCIMPLAVRGKELINRSVGHERIIGSSEAIVTPLC